MTHFVISCAAAVDADADADAVVVDAVVAVAAAVAGDGPHSLLKYDMSLYYLPTVAY